MHVSSEEIEYKWLEVASLYEQKIEDELTSGVLVAEYWQKIGLCYGLASRQANDVEDFKTLRRLGIGAYEKAADLFKQEIHVESAGKSEACLALAEYLRSWISVESSEKIRVLDKCRVLIGKAMKAFKALILPI